MIPVNPLALAWGVTAVPNSPVYDNQVHCTDSEHKWSDIVFTNSLLQTDAADLVTFRQWPTFMGKQTWRELLGLGLFPDQSQPFRSINSNCTLAGVVLHELMHSIGIANPTGTSPLIFCSIGFDANSRI